MTSIFSDSRAKISRSHQLIAELEREIAIYAARQPYYLEMLEGDSDRERREVTRTREPIPAIISIIVGDAIHNLRTSLDLLACETVRLTNNSDKGVYFPFAKDATDLEVQIRDKKINRAGDAVVELVRSLKPFFGGNVALRLIHDLDIRDKHQALIKASLLVPSQVPVYINGRRTYGIARQSLGTSTLHYLNRPELCDPVGTIRPIEFSLTFPAGTPFEWNDLVPGLKDLAKLTLGIVESFEALFLGEGKKSGTD